MATKKTGFETPDTTLQDLLDGVEQLDGRISDMGVDVAHIKLSLQNIERLLENIKDSMQ